MKPLDPYTESLLASYREQTQAAPQASKRNWERVAARTGPTRVGPTRSPWQRLPMRAAVLGAAALAAAVLAVLLLREVAVSSPQRAMGVGLDAAPNVVRDAHSQGHETVIYSPAPQYKNVRPTDVPPGPVQNPPAEPPAAVAPDKGTAGVRAPARAKLAPRDVLGAESRLMNEARAALVAGRFSEVLALLRTHAKEFPRGVLIQERLGWRVIALCRLGRDHQQALRVFSARFSGSALARRVQQQCRGSFGDGTMAPPARGQ